MRRPQPIEETRVLAPGIAYIRFGGFPGAPETVEAARRFMEENAGARTIIFDIRTHRGGGLAEMDAMFPYLFGKETALVRMDTRASVERQHGSPVAGVPTLKVLPAGDDVVGREHFVKPHASEKRLFGAKVFVLTSGATASAAEHFALSLKRTGRATLIGEPTGGAGHYGGVRPFAGDKWSVFVPVGRTYDPATGKGWEGDGVAPDVAVPAARALAEALVRSGLSPEEAERIAAEVKVEGPMERRRRPTA
jgi:C-terminal processing protease CtpA/Prc